ncbi:hypothetical protein [Streptomyces pseudogriseolus]|uniref:hypothetical protein n=1 Tax=Streptomyces pseudogriseolus TaxID=36817 RepID=UPI00364B2758
MSERLTPQREAEIDARAGHLYEYSTRHNDDWDVLAGEDVPALLAELSALRAERDQAREKALREAASHFDRMADREPDPHGYRARVMRGAANDIRRFAVATAPTAGES